MQKLKRTISTNSFLGLLRFVDFIFLSQIGIDIM